MKQLLFSILLVLGIGLVGCGRKHDNEFDDAWRFSHFKKLNDSTYLVFGKDITDTLMIYENIDTTKNYTP